MANTAPQHVHDLVQQIKDNVASKVAATQQPANTQNSESKGN